MSDVFKKLINKSVRPFIIAEMSANHDGSISKAKKMITAAKKAGASAIKIQTYEAKSMTIKSQKKDFLIKHGLWKGQNLYDLYKSAETPFSWHKKLFSHAKKENIIIFSTPFDYDGVEFTLWFKCTFFKVASFEITDIPLIEYIASKKETNIIINWNVKQRRNCRSNRSHKNEWCK